MKTILIQLDTDSLPSTFDRVVAVDSDVDHLFSYGGVSPENVTGLVHGAIFTRGPKDLNRTAIFIGGSDVAAGEALLKKVSSTFFGPMRVSVMMDSNGCNTTAAAAVVAAKQHLRLDQTQAVVLGGTGPVGLRVAQLLGQEHAQVTLVSRSLDRASAAVKGMASQVEGDLSAAAASSADEVRAVCEGKPLVVAAGAAGVCFLPEGSLAQLSGLQVAIDLNAVPPTGLADLAATDKAAEKNGVTCYGALGVGGTKMKVHRQAIARLFSTNDAVLDTLPIYQIALEVAGIVS